MAIKNNDFIQEEKRQIKEDGKLSGDIALIADALKSAISTKAIDNRTKQHLLEADFSHPVKTEVFFQDFWDFSSSGRIEGKKLRVTKFFKNKVQKSSLAGICKKKKNVWKWVTLTSVGLEILNAKNFDHSLKEINAEEKKLLADLKQKVWNVESNVDSQK